MTESTKKSRLEVTARGNKALAMTLVREEDGRILYLGLGGPAPAVNAIGAQVNSKTSGSEHTVWKLEYEGSKITDFKRLYRNYDDTTRFRMLPVVSLIPDFFAGGTFDLSITAQRPTIEKGDKPDPDRMATFTMLLRPEMHEPDLFYRMASAHVPVPMLADWRGPMWDIIKGLDPEEDEGCGVTSLICEGMAPIFDRGYTVKLRPSILEAVIADLGKSGQIRPGLEVN